ncbi:gamma-glutamylcyclotransferase family protein [Aquabacter cavernae]|uniref:gamma-glutamylcyclotransferase family protein n=1 Tax=Aquabacter cavernae TaxID=2496029 RepID=UPI001FDF3F99|nr:gamma-glutamylcyclotransferase family protein [Aquabacter cavernae]
MLTRRTFLAGAAAILAAGPATAQTSFWGRRLPEPTDFIFGYGSLMSTASREGTGHPGMHALAARLSPEFGLVRSWCARSERLGFTALGLRPLKAGEAGWSINGVVFPVEPAVLPRFDRRESGYDRVAVPRALIEGVSWEGLPQGGTIWAYVPRRRPGAGEEPLLPNLACPILQSYLDLCLQGALETGTDFAREMIATTADWGTFWLNDREIARRPWVANRDAGTIDELLAATPPAAEAFGARLYSEAYAVRMMKEGAPR